ncbi:hypothetical protein FAI40_08280 [Acetobacteraceae bacterium]|nr:hypothetical protein FAI40_08280 [Acetobacteraceae bacterium]
MSFLLNFFKNTLKNKRYNYYRLGKIAEENPDLPMSFIKESLLAKADMEAGNVTTFSFSKKMTKFTELKIEKFLENEEDIKGFLQETAQLNDGDSEDFKATLHALKLVTRAMSRINLAKSSKALKSLKTAEDIHLRKDVEAGIRNMREGRFCTLKQLDEKISTILTKAERQASSKK